MTSHLIFLGIVWVTSLVKRNLKLLSWFFETDLGWWILMDPTSCQALARPPQKKTTHQSRKFLGDWPITQHLRERQGPVHGLGFHFYSKNNTNHIITHICKHILCVLKMYENEFCRHLKDCHWIGFRENLKEPPIFICDGSNHGFL